MRHDVLTRSCCSKYHRSNALHTCTGLVNLILTFSKIIFNLQSCWQLAYKSISPLGKCVARTQLPSYSLSAVADAVAGSSVGLLWMVLAHTFWCMPNVKAKVHWFVQQSCKSLSQLIDSRRLLCSLAMSLFTFHVYHFLLERHFRGGSSQMSSLT